jgi:PIN domain nuclease of toxin-antitoxin system
VSYLLDTHVLLWWLVDDDRLATDMKHLIDTDPMVFLSSANVWEIGIKQALGKLSLSVNLTEVLEDSGLRQLPILLVHAAEASSLPPIHRDPFDRMLVGQARCEGLTLISQDDVLQDYDVPVLKV